MLDCFERNGENIVNRGLWKIHSGVYFQEGALKTFWNISKKFDEDFSYTQAKIYNSLASNTEARKARNSICRIVILSRRDLEKEFRETVRKRADKKLEKLSAKLRKLDDMLSSL